MATSALQNKQPTTKREPLLSHLVIPDLQEMEKSGAYDRNVLLWLQNSYVERAISEHWMDLKAINKQVDSTESSKEDKQRQRWDALAKYTRESYSSQKAGGNGIDLKSYFDAAKTFFEQEALRYGGHLKEVAEYIQKALANGEKPDIERHARHCYISYSKMGGAMSKLENLSGKPAAQPIARYMNECIENITFDVVGGQEKAVGRAILQLVEKIAEKPERYIEFRDPSTISMADRDPWAFEPMHRQAGAHEM